MLIKMLNTEENEPKTLPIEEAKTAEEPKVDETKTLPAEEVKPAEEIKTDDPKSYFKIGRLKLKKKIALIIAFPLVLLTIFFIGLYQQGYINDWLGHKATVRLVVVNQQKEPIQSAQVIIQQQVITTDESGVAIIPELKVGTHKLVVRRTGYHEFSQEFNLVNGDNDLGDITLKETPVERISFSLLINNYVTNRPVTNVQVTLGDLRAIFRDGRWHFVDVTLAEYQLKIEGSDFNTFQTEINVTETMAGLRPILLVPRGRVAFESNRDQGLRGVFTANYDGSDQKPLINRVGQFEDFSPLLDPNHRRVLFFSTRDGVKDDQGELKNALYLVNIDGTGLVRISEDAQLYSGLWSRTGRFIMFTTYEGARGFIVNLYDASRNHLIALNPYFNFNNYAISPDERLIAFTAKVGAEPTRTYIGSTDGTNTRLVDERESWALEFTPNNHLRYVLFDNNRIRHFEFNPTNSVRAEISSPAIDRNANAVLSPNQNLRAYVSTRDGKTNLFVSNPDGTNEIQLTTLHFVHHNDIVWSLDSSFILFNISAPGETARFLISADGASDPKKIVDINLIR